MRNVVPTGLDAQYEIYCGYQNFIPTGLKSRKIKNVQPKSRRDGIMVERIDY